jgi:hypothetical protein
MSGACIRGVCENTKAAVYCNPANCKVGPDCGNRVEDLACLRLARCKFGLGVMSTVPLPCQPAAGEYCGVLRYVDGFSDAMRGSSFGFEFSEKSSAREDVDIDASQSGNLSRFVNHSCVPNCRF